MAEKKDKMFSGSTVKFGKNSKGNDRVQFYLKKEDAEELAALMVENASAGAGTGVQLDIHQTVSEHQGRTIRGGFLFCKAKQAQTQRQTTNNYAPANGGKTQEQIIAELQAQLAAKQVG